MKTALKRFINWIAGVREIEDPNIAYPPILDDICIAEIARRLQEIDYDEEDDTSNFDTGE